MYIMITKNDIDRITNNKFKIERLINNAVTACKRSQTNWSKDYWHGVFTKLCKKYNRNDLNAVTFNSRVAPKQRHRLS